jgi:hypothetical protein
MLPGKTSRWRSQSRRKIAEEKFLLRTRVENKIARVHHSFARHPSRPATLLAIALLALLSCGCSSFNREWRRVQNTPVRLDSLEGRWEGRWLSDANGHNGNLRCLITHTNGTEYAARFRATYLWVLRFSYTVPLQVEPHDGGWRFHGAEDLGKAAGGLYRYTGTATATNFHSTYDSKYDHGVFEMNRVAGKNSTSHDRHMLPRP